MSIRDLIQMEPTEPQNSILAELKKLDGKLLTARTIDALKKATGDASIRLDKSYTMTHIEWGDYRISGGRRGGALLVSHDIKNVRIDAAYIEEHNIAYFAALVERNRERANLLAAGDTLDKLEGAINAYNAAREELNTLLDSLEVDRYKIEKALVAGRDK